MYSIVGKRITKQTVIYGVYIHAVMANPTYSVYMWLWSTLIIIMKPAFECTTCHIKSMGSYYYTLY